MAIPGLSPEMKNFFSNMNPPKAAPVISGAAGGPINSSQITKSVHEKALDNTPTKDLDSDPLSYRSISYPKDVTNNMANGHYMIFYVNVQNKTKYKFNTETEGVTVGGKLEVEVPVANPHGEFQGTGRYHYIDIASDKLEEVNYQKNLIAKGGKGNYLTNNEIFLRPNVADTNGGVGSLFPTTTRITDSVALYLPANVQDTTNARYDSLETGIVGLVAAGGGAFLNAMKRNDYELAAKSLIGGVKAITQEALRKAGGAFVDTLAGVEGSAELANKAFGQATNPYMEVMFNQMELRKFTYSFTFSPRNADETEDVQTIIQLFRFHMAPELKGAQKRFLTLPSTFDIHYMYQHSNDYAAENNFYSKIATCVLESCDVNYTPNGVKSFQDGAPTQITMSLGFQETEILTKSKINDGY